MANLNFNSQGVERNNFEPIPSGDYPAMIIESTMKHPKGAFSEPDKSKPAYLELKIVVIDGEFKGRQVIDRLNLNNPNEMTRKIAKGTLAGICDALGMVNVDDSSDLHNKPMLIKITVKPASGEYGAGNEVKGYKMIGVPSSQTSAVQQVQAQATQSANKPWE